MFEVFLYINLSYWFFRINYTEVFISVGTVSKLGCFTSFCDPVSIPHLGGFGEAKIDPIESITFIHEYGRLDLFSHGSEEQ
jgi:hypothetical protein